VNLSNEPSVPGRSALWVGSFTLSDRRGAISTENMPCSKKVVLKPGEHFVSAERDVAISTLLGSCISACLYEPVRRIVGMNHFLLANHRYPREMPVCLSEAGRYGIHSMELIINGMMKMGASRQRIRAKVFGGSSMLPDSGTPGNFACVGEVNCRFIVEFLKNDGIPLMSSDLGGSRGRIILFDATDYSVYVRKIKAIAPKVIDRERRYWSNALQTHEQEETVAEIWE
jgi:chemotaxis protein CheD